MDSVISHARYVFLLVVGSVFLYAADERQQELANQAQADFDRVAVTATPGLPEAARCEQSQAALLAVALPADIPQIRFRKGFCALAAATITRNPADFAQAATEFDKSIAAWPARANKDFVPEPLSSGLRVLAAIAKLENDSGPATRDRARQELLEAVEPAHCESNLMPVDLCQTLVRKGRQWLGWIAIQSHDWYEASRQFESEPDNPWSHWLAGRKAFEFVQYEQAAVEYGLAADLWRRSAGSIPKGLAGLDPPPEMPAVWTDLAGAQILSGNYAEAIAELDRAVRADPNMARALFLRALARELSGQKNQALADYNLASRTALAHARDLESGEAHLYQGILLYRKGQYPEAENEFANALNFGLQDSLRPDASAWRHMAALASGGCASRPFLEDSLAGVTPFFPKTEAHKLAASCPLNPQSVASAAQ